MLSAHELARLCKRLGLPSEAQAVTQTIRSLPPARRVRSAAGNVAVRYPSRKMGVTIQAESHRVDRQQEEWSDPPWKVHAVVRLQLVVEYEAEEGRDQATENRA